MTKSMLFTVNKIVGFDAYVKCNLHSIPAPKLPIYPPPPPTPPMALSNSPFFELKRNGDFPSQLINLEPINYRA